MWVYEADSYSDCTAASVRLAHSERSKFAHLETVPALQLPRSMMFGPTLPLLLVMIPLTVAVVTILLGIASLFTRRTPAQPRRRTFEPVHAPIAPQLPMVVAPPQRPVVAPPPRPMVAPPVQRVARSMQVIADPYAQTARSLTSIPDSARRASTEFPVERTAIAGRPIGLPPMRPQLRPQLPSVTTAPPPPVRTRYPKGSQPFAVRPDRDFSDNAPTTLYGHAVESTTDVDLTPTPT